MQHLQKTGGTPFKPNIFLSPPAPRRSEVQTVDVSTCRLSEAILQLARDCEPAWWYLPTLDSTFTGRLSTSPARLFHGSRNTDHESRCVLSVFLATIPVVCLQAERTEQLPSSVCSSKFRIP